VNERYKRTNYTNIFVSVLFAFLVPLCIALPPLHLSHAAALLCIAHVLSAFLVPLCIGPPPPMHLSHAAALLCIAHIVPLPCHHAPYLLFFSFAGGAGKDSVTLFFCLLFIDWVKKMDYMIECLFGLKKWIT